VFQVAAKVNESFVLTWRVHKLSAFVLTGWHKAYHNRSRFHQRHQPNKCRSRWRQLQRHHNHGDICHLWHSQPGKDLLSRQLGVQSRWGVVWRNAASYK